MPFRMSEPSELLGNGIVPDRTTRPASKDALERQPTAFQQAEPAHRLQAIFRTRRCVSAARWEHRRNDHLVKPYEENPNFLGKRLYERYDLRAAHSPSPKAACCIAFRYPSSSLVNSMSLVFLLATNTTSKPSNGNPSCWLAARIRRFARFLHTAFPSFLPATKATRPCRPCCSSSFKTKSMLGPCPNRLPCLKTRVMSALDLITSNTSTSRNGYTVRRLRPLARRAFRTLRPPLVAIRARKPWVLARFLLFGW